MAGALAALPAGNRAAALACGLAAAALDVDHAASYAGLPVPGRASHTLLFLALAPLALAQASRAGWFAGLGAPRMVWAITFAAVLSHFAWDSLSTAAGLPLLLPFATGEAGPAPLLGVALQTLGTVAVWAAARARRVSRPPAVP